MTRDDPHLEILRLGESSPVLFRIRVPIPKHNCAPSSSAVDFRLMNTQVKSKFIAVLDDDDSVRSALQGLLKAVGLPAQTYASAAEFLKSSPRHQIGYLISGIRIPGMSGL